MCNLSQGIEDRAIRKGIRQGIEQGIEQERARAEAEKSEIAKEMLQDGMLMETVAKYSKLSLETLQKLL